MNKKINYAIPIIACGFLAVLAITFLVPMGSVIKMGEFCGMGLSFVVDGFRTVHGILACFMWLIATVFSREYMQTDKHQNRYYLFLILTMIATLGVFYSADLYTTFIFFEMMSFTSFVWVAQDEKEKSLHASKVYLAIAVIGGMVMLMGLFLLYHLCGTLEISALSGAISKQSSDILLYVAGFCLFFGFGAKAGVFGLHVWMPESYTYSPAPESALLSGILSKTGLYGIIVVTSSLFMGETTRNINYGAIVVVLGLLTMATGAILAVFSVNLKRILACSSMSQIGFMLTGVGVCALLNEEGTIAARGTLLHMVNHSLIKLVLFIAAGIIFMNLGKLDLNEIRGYGRKKPLLNYVVLMSALGIGGIPLWNGYISKTLLHEGIIEAMDMGIISGNFLRISEWIFLISGGFTLAYMSKLYIAIFIEKNKDEEIQKEYDVKKPYVGKVTALFLFIIATVMPIIGSLPQLTLDKLADFMQGIWNVPILKESVSYFNLENLKGGLCSILIGIVVYIGIVRICLMDQKNYKEYWPKWMNIQKYLYRPLILIAMPAVGGFFARITDSLVDNLVVFIRKTIMKDSPLPSELEEGNRTTYHLGKIADGVMKCYYSITKKHRKDSVSYVHKIAVKYTELVENNVIIGRSLSFGLLLFCIGLSLTLVYILFW